MMVWASEINPPPPIPCKARARASVSMLGAKAQLVANAHGFRLTLSDYPHLG